MKKKQLCEAALIFPHQLFEYHQVFEKNIPMIMWEAPHFFTRFTFHKAKIVLHRASMQFYKDHLKKKKYIITYCTFNESLEKLLKHQKIDKLLYIDPVDTTVERQLKKICRILSIKTEKYDTPAFMLSSTQVQEQFSAKKTFRMYPFYVKQRKQFAILTHNEKPIGGKWTFDTENRKKIPPNMIIPPLWTPKKNKYVREGINYVQKHFPKNPGTIDHFCYPVTFNDADRWFDDFLKNRFSSFGEYQDAINHEQPFLFHSVLSPLLNIGLLIPHVIIEKAVKYGATNKVPINSIEGFVRQILQWREYVRGIYQVHGEIQQNSNFFNHTQKLSSAWWDGSTGIEPIDSTIKKILSYGYAHHIERLMILGNYMLLRQTKPSAVHQWFMELFIDAYDWVMIPNIFGMSQFADGGLMMTKPYISTSHYIQTMSTHFKKAAWCEQWNALYWHFLYCNKKKLSSNSRMILAYQQLKRLTPPQLKKYIKIAQSLSESSIHAELRNDIR
ncbi:MAG: Deoxyribodipyrimidine photo-lyase-related protein [Candidatus Dependentiae bacterium ADurb.Bin331]|nr:MAG: Deoxyribodipyrimidine photo-lyase-related protein [Candidatus Dependentiae bacterium ADurb.Bin331]